MSADPLLPINSDRCKCVTCGRYFSSVASFDRHRLDGRCRTEDEMVAKGMALNEKGYWVTKLYAHPPSQNPI